MKRLIPYGALAALVLFMGLLTRIAPVQMPQGLAGGDFLSVLLGDAKKDISGAMVREADSYFHGGVDIDCHHLHGHPDRARHDHDLGARHEHHADEEHDREEMSFDPWRWINAHVRAPEVDRHLDGSKAVELMPWFWAAVRADPHNVDAWTTAAYAADRMIGDRSLARRVLREARERNPCSLDIALAEARMVYDGGSGDVAAAERLFEEARAAGKRLCGGRLAALSAHDAEMYCDILDYLSKIYESRGERAAIHALADEARATGAATPAVKAVESREQER